MAEDRGGSAAAHGAAVPVADGRAGCGTAESTQSRDRAERNLRRNLSKPLVFLGNVLKKLKGSDEERKKVGRKGRKER